MQNETQAGAVSQEPGGQEARAEFIEALGFLVETIRWMPRMTGRVLGCLLVADAPLTQAELRDQLDASLGAVSGATRSLLEKRFALRVSLPGSRQTGLVIHPDAWRNMEEDGIGNVRDYAKLAQHTLSALGETDSPAAQSLGNMHAYFTQVEARMRDVLAWFDETQARPQDPGAQARS